MLTTLRLGGSFRWKSQLLISLLLKISMTFWLKMIEKMDMINVKLHTILNMKNLNPKLLSAGSGLIGEC